MASMLLKFFRIPFHVGLSLMNTKHSVRFLNPFRNCLVLKLELLSDIARYLMLWLFCFSVDGLVSLTSLNLSGNLIKSLPERYVQLQAYFFYLLN